MVSLMKCCNPLYDLKRMTSYALFMPTCFLTIIFNFSGESETNTTTVFLHVLDFF